MKRLGDVLLGSLLLFFLGIPMLCIALIISIGSGSPVLFRQIRMGRYGHPFIILKFRTMRPRSEGDAAITSGDSDHRITREGSVLRRYRIDEWPQLLNVLKGDMSLVGPRPEVPEFVDLKDSNWQLALSVRPGITGPDALAFRNEGERLAQSAHPEQCYREEILPEKLAIQIQYAQNRTLVGDLRLLFRTLVALRG